MGNFSLNLLSELKKVLPARLYNELSFQLKGQINNAQEFREMKSFKSKWKEISFDHVEKSTSPKKILAVTGYGLTSHYQTIEPIILSALAARGHKVYSFYCGQSLSVCEMNLTGNDRKSPSNEVLGFSSNCDSQVCLQCKKSIEYFYKGFPFELIKYSEYFNNDTVLKAKAFSDQHASFEKYQTAKHLGVDIGEEVRSSIIRATFMGQVSETSENLSHVKRYLDAGYRLVDALRNCIDHHSIDTIIAIHGIYLTHGLTAKLGKSMSIPTWILGGGGIRKNTVILSAGDTYHRTLVDDTNFNPAEIVLSSDQRERVFSYAEAKKFDGAAADYRLYNPDPIEDLASVRSLLGLSEDDKIVSVFTNVIWDAQIIYSSNAFSDIFEWISDCIINLGKNSNIKFVIRIHPAETKGNTNKTLQPMLNEIRRMFEILPENCIIVPPESNISSYTLGAMSHANIVYGTKLSLELALMGRRVIVCGETFSRGKGFTLDVDSRDQFAAICDHILDVKSMSQEETEIAVKYAHYLYFNRMIDLPYDIGDVKLGDIGKKLKFKSTSELIRDNGVGKILKLVEGK